MDNMEKKSLELEKEIIIQTKANIEKVRKGKIVLKFKDSNGEAVKGKKVHINQKRHEFLFGGNIFGFDKMPSEEANQLYKEAFAGIFNFATLPFYWRGYEAVQGEPNYDYTQSILEWCRKHGIKPKGHPLAWRHEAAVPDWLPKDPSEIWKLLEKRVKDILLRFENQIDVWDVYNEPVHCSLIKDMLSPAYQPANLKETIDEVADVLQWTIQSGIPGTYIVNEFNVMHGSANDRFIRLLDELINRGIRFEGIGIQAHEPIGSRYDLNQVMNVLDRFTLLGKELHITEFTPTSGGQKILGSWKSGEWNEEEQAEYAEKFYRVCFSHPGVRAITWWDLSDYNSWQQGGGLLKADMTPKPAYERLKQLIREEWSTSLEIISDENGEAVVEGFYGDYDAQIELSGGFERTLEFALKKGQSEPLEIKI